MAVKSRLALPLPPKFSWIWYSLVFVPSFGFRIPDCILGTMVSSLYACHYDTDGIVSRG